VCFASSSRMLKSRPALVLLALLTLILATDDVLARSGGRSGGRGGGHYAGARHGGHHRSHSHVFFGAGIGFGSAYWLPYYAYSPYPYAYGGGAMSTPLQYIEKADESAGAGDWFYCPSSSTYFPYVTQCAEPWHRVTPY
jgi:hypothetical protein